MSLLNWSSERHFYVHDLAESGNKTGSKTVCIKFHINNDGDLVPTRYTSNPFSGIVSIVDNDQKAVVTGLYVKFIHNEFNKDVWISITDLFIGKNENSEDDTKPIRFLCPAKFHGLVGGSNEMIYKPLLSKKEIYMYANQERFIFEPNLTELPNNIKCFKENHQLISSLLERGLKLNNLEKTKENGTTYFKIDEEKMAKTSEYFQDKVFTNIHYTRFEQFEIKTDLKIKIVDLAITQLCLFLYHHHYHHHH